MKLTIFHDRIYEYVMFDNDDSRLAGMFLESRIRNLKGHLQGWKTEAA